MLQGIGPGLAPTEIATMEQDIETSLWQERLLATLSGVFAALAAAIAGLGVFAMLAYAVARRTREIGIRVAVGADRKRIAALVARDAAYTLAPGLAAGIAAYAACSRAMVVARLWSRSRSTRSRSRRDDGISHRRRRAFHGRARTCGGARRAGRCSSE